MWFYSVILFFSFIFPFALSFDKKVAFHAHWRTLLPAIALVAVFFIAFDVLYTRWGVWGFNPEYYLGIHILNLPLEEVLFFILIPYSSIFLHYVLRFYLPNFQLNKKNSNTLSYFLLALLLGLSLMYYDRLYTIYSLLLVVAALILGIFDKKNEMGAFFFTFSVMLVPFTLVNGLLTGSFLGREVVWYDNAENCGVRFLTIPLEDISYAFGMLFFSLWIKNKIEGKSHKSNRL